MKYYHKLRFIGPCGILISLILPFFNFNVPNYMGPLNGYQLIQGLNALPRFINIIFMVPNLFGDYRVPPHLNIFLNYQELLLLFPYIAVVAIIDSYFLRNSFSVSPYIIKLPAFFAGLIPIIYTILIVKVISEYCDIYTGLMAKVSHDGAIQGPLIGFYFFISSCLLSIISVFQD
jgi:hypothetical protein